MVSGSLESQKKLCMSVAEFPGKREGKQTQSARPGMGLQLCVAINHSQHGQVTTLQVESSKQQNHGPDLPLSPQRTTQLHATGVCKVWRLKQGHVLEIKMLGHRLGEHSMRTKLRREE